MKVIGFDRFGGPEVLREFEVPDPTPGDGQVRVRVRAAAVSPTDTLRRAGMRREEMAKMPTPYVVGMDFAGTLDELGMGVETDLEVGDAVMGIVLPWGSNGAYAEQVVVPAESIARLPRGSDFAAASTLPMNGLTARLSLDTLGLKPGQTLAVTGAAGTYGGYVIQLAKVDGLRVIADAAPKDRSIVDQLGADEIVERGDDVAERILELSPGGVDGLADGALLNDRIVGAVRDGGGIVTLRTFSGEPERGITWHPIQVRDYLHEQGKLDELRGLAEEGSLDLRVADTYPAVDASKAHERLAGGGVRGRLVLLFN